MAKVTVKRIIIFLLLGFIFGASSKLLACGDIEEFENGDFRYGILSEDSESKQENKYATITGLTKSGAAKKVLEIPSEIDGYTVKALGYNKPILGGSIEKIICSSLLRNLKLPSTLQYIEKSALVGCDFLTYIDISDCPNVTIMDNSINKQAALVSDKNNISEDLLIRDGVLERYIGFEEMVEIPDTVAEIAPYAFYGRDTIKAINSSELVDLVGLHCGAYSFAYTEIVKVRVGDVAESLFQNCETLEEVELYGSVNIDYKAFYNCVNLARIDLTLVNSIGSWAFFNCDALKAVELKSVINVGNNAFGDSGLTEINFYDFNDIKYSIVENCDNLNAIAVSEDNANFSSVDGVLFEEKSFGKELTIFPQARAGNYVIPDGVLAVGEKAFKSSKLEKLDLNQVESIGNSALSSSDIKSIDFSRIKTIERYAFAYTKLTYGDLSNVESINYSAFEGSDISKIKVRLQSFSSKRIFANCKALSEVELLNGTTVIPEEAFRGCLNLKSISLPPLLEYIGDKAFEGCSSLETVEIPDSITVLEYGVFAECVSLKSISLSKNTQSIDDKAFYNCTALQSITLPDTLKTIRRGAFAYSGLKLLHIPLSVKTIGGGILEGCGVLQEIETEVSAKPDDWADDWNMDIKREEVGCLYKNETLHYHKVVWGVSK